jgi:phycocyanobilin:ferredoxin oxidoreductase
VHVEYAATTPRDIEIVHSVAYPETRYEVPILGIDVVTVAGVPKFAICDLTMPGFSLSYWNTLAFDLQGKYDLVSNRAVPDWAWIFSDSCLCIKNPDIDAFGAYVAELTETYAAVAALFPSNHDYHACHKAYCEAQRQNAKTRGMLTASFSAEFADKYMRFMFDV